MMIHPLSDEVKVAIYQYFLDDGASSDVKNLVSNVLDWLNRDDPAFNSNIFGVENQEGTIKFLGHFGPEDTFLIELDEFRKWMRHLSQNEAKLLGADDPKLVSKTYTPLFLRAKNRKRTKRK